MHGQQNIKIARKISREKYGGRYTHHTRRKQQIHVLLLYPWSSKIYHWLETNCYNL
jgi:hypothetical protein